MFYTVVIGTEQYKVIGSHDTFDRAVEHLQENFNWLRLVIIRDGSTGKRYTKHMIEREGARPLSQSLKEWNSAARN